MTVNTTHPRPDARLDSSRAGITPGARREEHRATARERPGTAPRRGACPRCPADAPRHAPRPPRRGRHPHRRARTEAEGSQARRPRAVASPGSTPPGAGATRVRRVRRVTTPGPASPGDPTWDPRWHLRDQRSPIRRCRHLRVLASCCREPSCVHFSYLTAYAYVTPPCPRNVTPFLTRGWMFCRPLALVLAPRLTGLTTVPPRSRMISPQRPSSDALVAPPMPLMAAAIAFATRACLRAHRLSACAALASRRATPGRSCA